MPSKARQKNIMEKLNRAQKCSILGPQNLGSGGPPGPPLDPHLPDYPQHLVIISRTYLPGEKWLPMVTNSDQSTGNTTKEEETSRDDCI